MGPKDLTATVRLVVRIPSGRVAVDVAQLQTACYLLRIATIGLTAKHLQVKLQWITDHDVKATLECHVDEPAVQTQGLNGHPAGFTVGLKEGEQRFAVR